MALGRMAMWRESQRRRAGGMVEVSTWVPQRAADFLKDIFGRLADPGERGDDYRSIVASWRFRRRVVGPVYDGSDYSAEIDRPRLGAHWYSRPIGGRVIQSSQETWIELTPDEAEEVHRLCERTVSDALSSWLNNRNLKGRIVDKVGVALDTFFAEPEYRARDGEIVLRPRSDAEFIESEVEIAQAVKDDALRSRLHHTENPAVTYYPGSFGLPSRCYVVHRRVGSTVLFAMAHIYEGGTSPTIIFRDLAKRFHKQFYPDVKFESIQWFDCWRQIWEPSKALKISRVRISENGGDTEWEHGAQVPEDFREEIERLYLLEESSDPERGAVRGL